MGQKSMQQRKQKMVEKDAKEEKEDEKGFYLNSFKKRLKAFREKNRQNWRYTGAEKCLELHAPIDAICVVYQLTKL